MKRECKLDCPPADFELVDDFFDDGGYDDDEPAAHYDSDHCLLAFSSEEKE